MCPDCYDSFAESLRLSSHQCPLPVALGRSLLHLLGHKGPPWLWQIQRCLEDDLSPMRSWHFLARLGPEPVANVSLSVCRGYGILGHVFVSAAYRKRGLAQALLRRAVQAEPDARIYLGTAPETQGLYQSVGFQELVPGFMVRPGCAAGSPPQPEGRRPLVIQDWPEVVHLGSLQASPVCWEGRCLEVLRESPPGQAWAEVRGGQLVAWSG